MIHIATDLDISPATARVMAEAFAKMAESDEPIDDADGDEVKAMFGALAKAIGEAKAIDYAVAMNFDGDALKIDGLGVRAGETFVQMDRQARDVGVTGRIVRAKFTLLYVDDDGEGAAVDVRQEFAPRPAVLDPEHYPEDAALLRPEET